MLSFRLFSLLLILHKSNGFLLLPSAATNIGITRPSFYYLSSTMIQNQHTNGGNGDGDCNNTADFNCDDDSTDPVIKSSSSLFEMEESTIKIDDGGSNLTDRFKYKVHALMGTYDPGEGAVDDEGQDGNILKAMLTFPTQFVFHVVGRKSSTSNDEDHNNDYAKRVQKIVCKNTGDDSIECVIIPRGKSFIKVRCTATVQSATMINTIYEELDRMETTVFKY